MEIWLVVSEYADKVQKVLTPRENLISMSCEYTHLHSISFLTTKFYEFCLAVSGELRW